MINKIDPVTEEKTEEDEVVYITVEELGLDADYEEDEEIEDEEGADHAAG